MKRTNIWYSYTLKPYLLNEPGFYKKEDFEWTKLLEDNFEVIKKETLAFVQNNQLKPYFNKSLLSKTNSWKTEGLLFWGYFFRKNHAPFKATWKVAKQIPGIVSFSISELDPESKIKLHNGDTNAIIRVHLPIVVPSGLPECAFTVKGETRAWEEGKVILFNDAQLHEAQNLTNQKRLVLLIDVIRPEFLDRKREICGKVLNGLAWQAITQSKPKIRNYPLWVKKLLWSSIRFSARMVLRVNRIFWP
jgi:aspartyl/asparaginyl beta-hydroxylase (cupin superfamily)